MNLNLIAYPGIAQNTAKAHIEQRIQVPHVPLKFNSDEQNPTLVAIIDDPIKSITRAQDNSNLELFISLYNKTLEEATKAKYIYHEDDVINNANAFIIDLFDKLNLEDQNYKNKTGRESLRDDVINKTQVHVEKYDTHSGQIDTDSCDLEKSWELYNSALNLCIRLL
jgi:hypothetical protein